jgi:hypothetical protein
VPQFSDALAPRFLSRSPRTIIVPFSHWCAKLRSSRSIVFDKSKCDNNVVVELTTSRRRRGASLRNARARTLESITIVFRGFHAACRNNSTQIQVASRVGGPGFLRERETRIERANLQRKSKSNLISRMCTCMEREDLLAVAIYRSIKIETRGTWLFWMNFG